MGFRVLRLGIDLGCDQLQQLGFGDIWYFPKGVAHTIQGLDDDNEYLLTFDDGDFNAVG